ncbi:MAG: hypothetical protein M3552_20000 [Planctomycetota bacterium]|nr:hypothetical protein [Planctomycetota bacterium]
MADLEQAIGQLQSDLEGAVGQPLRRGDGGFEFDVDPGKLREAMDAFEKSLREMGFEPPGERQSNIPFG